MKKQNPSPEPQAPQVAQAQKLTLKKSSKKLVPSFPKKKKTMPEGMAKDVKASSPASGISSIDGPGAQEIDPRDVKTAGAVLDIPFRAANLVWKDVPALTKEEIEYMAEPLAEILVDLDWMGKLRGPYLKLGWGLSIAVVSRVRAHELVKAEKKKAAEKAQAGPPAAAGAGPAGKAGAMEPGRE